VANDDEDLRINTLHRFAKHSQKLVLHEYSHCEVPAGCGGVVLRWIDPHQGVPAQIRLTAAAARGSLWLDGNSLASALFQLRPGVRVFALHLTRTKPIAQPFCLHVAFDRRDDATVRLGTGRYTPTAPDETWLEPAFDDRAWPLLPLASADLIAASDRRGSFEWNAERGVTVYGLEHDELWARFTTTVVAP
jgi:hypothetical protein